MLGRHLDCRSRFRSAKSTQTEATDKAQLRSLNGLLHFSIDPVSTYQRSRLPCLDPSARLPISTRLFPSDLPLKTYLSQFWPSTHADSVLNLGSHHLTASNAELRLLVAYFPVSQARSWERRNTSLPQMAQLLATCTKHLTSSSNCNTTLLPNFTLVQPVFFSTRTLTDLTFVLLDPSKIKGRSLGWKLHR